MITKKEIEKNQENCYSCKRQFKLKEKNIYKLSLGNFDNVDPYDSTYGSSVFAYVSGNRDCDQITASISFCDACWKSIAGEQYIISKDGFEELE